MIVPTAPMDLNACIYIAGHRGVAGPDLLCLARRRLLKGERQDGDKCKRLRAGSRFRAVQSGVGRYKNPVRLR